MDAWDEAVDEEDAVVTGFRSLERWEIVTYLAWAIALLLLLNAWVWLHRAQEAGLL